MSAPKDQHYINRESSWIQFNHRVLAEAIDETNPLLERLKFVGIVSSNLDEFFMARVASLNPENPDFPKIHDEAFALMNKQNTFFIDVLVPELSKNGIIRVSHNSLSERQRLYVESLFHKEIMPLLTPIAVRDANPVPTLINLSLYQVIEAIKPKENQSHFALIEVPKNYPRMIALPSDQTYEFILLEDVIALYAGVLFPGYNVISNGLIRITRAAEMTLDEEKDEDFATVMSEALRSRRSSHIVRLEISASDKMADQLKDRFSINDHAVYHTSSWLDLKSISQLSFQSSFASLQRPKWLPCSVPPFEKAEDMWALISEQDILAHHPYESFDAFIKLISSAAEDPDVLAIKQTLYRAAHPSQVIESLERAAENGKQVTVIVELKARFDEQRNIDWAQRLINSGATVLYGVAGLKTHAKACLVVRREAEGIKRYVHLSTGNYNEKTAKLYTDLSLMKN